MDDVTILQYYERYSALKKRMERMRFFSPIAQIALGQSVIFLLTSRYAAALQRQLLAVERALAQARLPLGSYDPPASIPD